MKEREAISPGILIDAALTSSRDLSFSHEGLNAGESDAQALGNERSVDGKRLTIERDSLVIQVCHVTPYIEVERKCPADNERSR